MTGVILTDTKKILGLAEDYTAFDFDILTHINSTMMILEQIGIGPIGGLFVDETTTWDSLTGADVLRKAVKTYVYLRVRLLFDPPATSFALKAAEDQLREFEWRLNILHESTEWTPPAGDLDQLSRLS